MSDPIKEEMKDITGAESVQVQIRSDGKVIWVNVDGACVLRICRIRQGVELQDDRSGQRTEQ